MNKNIPAVNFTDFCKTASPQQISKALEFYTKPFDERLIGDYFLNWTRSFYDEGKIAHWTLRSNIAIIITISFKFYKNRLLLFTEHDPVIQIPNTFSEFISDLLRYPEFNLILTDKAYDEIYGAVTENGQASNVTVTPRHHGSHIEIMMKNGNYFKITHWDKNDFIEVNAQGGRILVNPQATNLVKIYASED